MDYEEDSGKYYCQKCERLWDSSEVEWARMICEVVIECQKLEKDSVVHVHIAVLYFTILNGMVNTKEFVQKDRDKFEIY